MSDESSKKNTVVNQSGGITIEHVEKMIVEGDMVGRDKNIGGGGTTPPPGGASVSTVSSAPPLELAIRFGKPASNAADATVPVSVDVKDLDLSCGPVDFVIPLDESVQQELRWYLELYPQWPREPDYEHARNIEAQLRIWGKQLFDAVFATPDMRSVYADFRNADAERRHLAIYATDPRVLRLPWELFADEQGYLFTKRRPVGIRRRIQRSQTIGREPFRLPANILMIVSRPNDASFIDPRSSAEALLTAVKPIQDRINVEFLYPPTLEALNERLSNPDLPAVHIVHFDGHGVYSPATGLGYLQQVQN